MIFLILSWKFLRIDFIYIIADTRGDPHLSTFDVIFYTFNGHGEYVLLQVDNSENVEFQGRMIPILDDQGTETRATALTALAVRVGTSDTVQVKYKKDAFSTLS